MELNMDAEYACPLPLFVRNSDLLVPPFRCTTLRQQIAALTEGEYANAKREVDAIRAELGQAPLPTLQNTIDEKTSQ